MSQNKLVRDEASELLYLDALFFQFLLLRDCPSVPLSVRLPLCIYIGAKHLSLKSLEMIENADRISNLSGRVDIRLRRRGHLGQIAMVTCQLKSLSASANDFVAEETEVRGGPNKNKWL